MGVRVYASDDYAGMSTDVSSFYYGYEDVYCSVCKSFECQDSEEHYDDHEWAFVATWNGQSYKIKKSDLGGDEVLEKLLYGIGSVIGGEFKPLHQNTGADTTP